MAASMRVGLTLEQLHQVIDVLAEHGQADAARRASEALTRASATKQVEALAQLFHDEAVFVHMGGTMSKQQELGVIANGTIYCRHAEIHDTSVRFIDRTAILLSNIRLDAVVGGNEVSNPFMVTEVYV